MIRKLISTRSECFLFKDLLNYKLPFKIVIILIITTFSTNTICGLRKYFCDTYVHVENVINVKRRCNKRDKQGIVDHSMLVLWVSESKDTFTYESRENMQTLCCCFFLYTKKNQIEKAHIPNLCGLIWLRKHGNR